MFTLIIHVIASSRRNTELCLNWIQIRAAASAEDLYTFQSPWSNTLRSLRPNHVHSLEGNHDDDGDDYEEVRGSDGE